MPAAPDTVAIGPYRLGGDRPLFILGPCVIESADFLHEIGPRIRTIADAAEAVGAAGAAIRAALGLPPPPTPKP